MSAGNLLTTLFNAGVAVSIIATVLSLGMSFTLAQVLAPLRRIVPVILMVVVNCVLIPAAAWGLFTVFGIKAAYVTGPRSRRSAPQGRRDSRRPSSPSARTWH